ncbi:MAG: hypothetical protein ACPGC9_02205 [Cytophagales bacterium]
MTSIRQKIAAALAICFFGLLLGHRFASPTSQGAVQDNQSPIEAAEPELKGLSPQKNLPPTISYHAKSSGEGRKSPQQEKKPLSKALTGDDQDLPKRFQVVYDHPWWMIATIVGIGFFFYKRHLASLDETYLYLYDQGVDLNEVNECRETLLYECIMPGIYIKPEKLYKVIKFLLTKSAEIKCPPNKTINLVNIVCNFLDEIYLLKYHEDYIDNLYKLLDLLLSHGIDINAEAGWWNRAYTVLDAAYSKAISKHPIDKAIGLKTIRYLLDKGAYPWRQGNQHRRDEDWSRWYFNAGTRLSDITKHEEAMRYWDVIKIVCEDFEAKKRTGAYTCKERHVIHHWTGKDSINCPTSIVELICQFCIFIPDLYTLKNDEGKTIVDFAKKFGKFKVLNKIRKGTTNC